MAKKSGPKDKLEAVGAATEPLPAAPAPVPKFSFPNRSRCQRCGGLNTEAYSTKGPVQYRRCLSATCRETYKAGGTEL